MKRNTALAPVLDSSNQPTGVEGFVTGLQFCDPASPHAALVQARFHHAGFSPALFSQMAILCDPVLEGASPVRQAEFLAGRSLAQAALQRLGRPVAHIPIGPDRAPIWPQGIAGSLSHARGHCACLTLLDPAILAGVDIETIAEKQALDAIFRIALRGPERALIADQAQISPAVLATLIFSAKETLYKTLYPIVKRHFGFPCAELRELPMSDRLRLYLTEPLHPSLPAGMSFDIRFVTQDTHVLTWCICTRP